MTWKAKGGNVVDADDHVRIATYSPNDTLNTDPELAAVVAWLLENHYEEAKRAVQFSSELMRPLPKNGGSGSLPTTTLSTAENGWLVKGRVEAFGVGMLVVEVDHVDEIPNPGDKVVIHRG